MRALVFFRVSLSMSLCGLSHSMMAGFQEVFHTRRQKLKITRDATIMSTIFYWSRQVTRLVKIHLSMGGMERPHCKRACGMGENVTASFGNISTTVKKMCLLLSPLLHIEKQRHYFANKGPSSQGYGFSSGHVWM